MISQTRIKDWNFIYMKIFNDNDVKKNFSFFPGQFRWAHP